MSTSVGHLRVLSEAQWAEWNRTVDPYGVGVEEEVMLLDLSRGCALAQRVDDVLEVRSPPLLGYVSAETHQAAIELRIDPHESVGTAIAQLRALRILATVYTEPALGASHDHRVPAVGVR